MPVGRPSGVQETLFEITEPGRPDGYPRVTQEILAKSRGMELSAAKNPDMVSKFRSLADSLWFQRRTPISIEDVRRAADEHGFPYVPGNWMGSTFSECNAAGQPLWVRVGFVKATHKKSHARMVSTWIRK